MTHPKRTLYTLSAAALLLGAGPALAGEETARVCACCSPTAGSAEQPRAAAAGATTAAAPTVDREAALLNEIWGGP